MSEGLLGAMPPTPVAPAAAAAVAVTAAASPSPSPSPSSSTAAGAAHASGGFLPAAVAAAAAAATLADAINGDGSTPPLTRPSAAAAAASPFSSSSAAAAAAAAACVAVSHRGSPLHLASGWPPKLPAIETSDSNRASGAATGGVPVPHAHKASPRKLKGGGRSAPDSSLRATAESALAAFKSSGDMGALLRVLDYEERELKAEEWKSFKPAEIAAAARYLRVAELDDKDRRDAVLATGVLHAAVGVKPRSLTTLYWCSKCSQTRKPGSRTRIIQHILAHEEGGASDAEMADAADSAADSEDAAAAATTPRARPAQLARPVAPSILPDPLGSAAAISFYPHDLTTVEADDLLLKHMQFKHAVATDAQRQSVRDHLRCVKLKDAAVRDAAFSAVERGQCTLPGLSQLKTPHTSYYCSCLKYCFRNIGAMLTHILKTHCDEPLHAQSAASAPAPAAAAATRPRLGKRSHRFVINSSDDEEDVEAHFGRRPSLSSGVAGNRLHKKPRVDGSARRSPHRHAKRRSSSADLSEDFNDSDRGSDNHSEAAGASSESDNDMDAADSEGVGSSAPDSDCASVVDSDDDADADMDGSGMGVGAAAGGAAKGYVKRKTLGVPDYPADGVAVGAVAPGGRPPILSRDQELEYMLQLNFRPSDPSRKQWKYLRSWEETQANWPLVREWIVCQRVPRYLRSCHAFRKNQLLDVAGLSAARDNHVLFSCRCGTQPYKRLADTAPLLRHILWGKCKPTADSAAASAAAAGLPALPRASALAKPRSASSVRKAVGSSGVASAAHSGPHKPPRKPSADKLKARELYPPSKSKRGTALKRTRELAAALSEPTRASDAAAASGGGGGERPPEGGDECAAGGESDGSDWLAGLGDGADACDDDDDFGGRDEGRDHRDQGRAAGAALPAAQPPDRVRTPIPQAAVSTVPQPPPQKRQQQEQQGLSQTPAAQPTSAVGKMKTQADIKPTTADPTTRITPPVALAAAAEFSPPSEEGRIARLAAVATAGADARTALAASARQNLFGAEGAGAGGSAPPVPYPDVAVAAAIAPLRSELVALTQKLSKQSTRAEEQHADLLRDVASLRQQLTHERESLHSTLQQLSATQESLRRMAAEEREVRRAEAETQRRKELAARQEVATLQKLLHQSHEAKQQQFRSFMQLLQSQRETTLSVDDSGPQMGTQIHFDSDATAVPESAPAFWSSAHAPTAAAAASSPQVAPAKLKSQQSARTSVPSSTAFAATSHASRATTAAVAANGDVKEKDAAVPAAQSRDRSPPAPAPAVVAPGHPPRTVAHAVELAAMQMADDDW